MVGNLKVSKFLVRTNWQLLVLYKRAVNIPKNVDMPNPESTRTDGLTLNLDHVCEQNWYLIQGRESKVYILFTFGFFWTEFYNASAFISGLRVTDAKKFLASLLPPFFLGRCTVLQEGSSWAQTFCMRYLVGPHDCPLPYRCIFFIYTEFVKYEKHPQSFLINSSPDTQAGSAYRDLAMAGRNLLHRIVQCQAGKGQQNFVSQAWAIVLSSPLPTLYLSPLGIALFQSLALCKIKIY